MSGGWIRLPYAEKARLRGNRFWVGADQEFCFGDFPGGAVVKNLPANAGDTGSIPGLGRSHMLRSN